MNAVRSNNVSLKYQWFTSSGYKVIGFTKIEFVAKSQFLLNKNNTTHCIELLNVQIRENALFINVKTIPQSFMREGGGVECAF